MLLPKKAMDLPEYSIDQWRAALDRGQWTWRSLCEAFQRRIAGIDASGPTLRSVVEVNPDTLEIAERLDVEQRDQGPGGPLHGLPILVKDSLDTADRMMTTGGSLALVGNVATRDAAVVQRLREAGAY